MKEFAETLRDINERLDLPQPARSRVLLEIGSDLRDLYEYYRGEGLPSHEARAQAIEHCDLSEDALADLARLHSAPWRRFMDRFSEQAQTRWERILLVLMLAFIAAITGRMVTSVDVFRTAHDWVWLAMAVTAAATAFAAYKIYLAFIRQDHDPRRLHAGLTSLLVASCADLLIGAYGNWLGLYRAVRRTADDLGGLWLYAAEWLLEGASLLLVCLTAAILTALLWYLLANKVARIERAEAAALLDEC